MIFTCYKITNTINDKIYIGITQRDLAKRWKEHLNIARYNIQRSTHALHNAIKKYGESAFTVEVIGQSSNAEDIKLLEQDCIIRYNSLCVNKCGYNMTHGGDGTTGHIITEEARRNMSVAHKGKSNGPHSVETKQLISDIHKSNKHTPSLLCMARRKEKCEGVPRSEDVKTRIRNTLKGRPRPPEVIAKAIETRRRKKQEKLNG